MVKLLLPHNLEFFLDKLCACMAGHMTEFMMRCSKGGQVLISSLVLIIKYLDFSKNKTITLAWQQIENKNKCTHCQLKHQF